MLLSVALCCRILAYDSLGFRVLPYVAQCCPVLPYVAQCCPKLPNVPFPSSFKSEGKTITDSKEIADKFCKYFTNIGPNLASAIHEVNSSVNSFIGDVNLPPITLKPTNPCELESICSMFASGKAPGHDNMSMHVIKHSIHLISAPLSNIINLSLQKGIFPDKLKLTN